MQECGSADKEGVDSRACGSHIRIGGSKLQDEGWEGPPVQPPQVWAPVMAAMMDGVPDPDSDGEGDEDGDEDIDDEYMLFDPEAAGAAAPAVAADAVLHPVEEGQQQQQQRSSSSSSSRRWLWDRPQLASSRQLKTSSCLLQI